VGERTVVSVRQRRETDKELIQRVHMVARLFPKETEYGQSSETRFKFVIEEALVLAGYPRDTEHRSRRWKVVYRWMYGEAP
jgi:hypothetical protein